MGKDNNVFEVRDGSQWAMERGIRELGNYFKWTMKPLLSIRAIPNASDRKKMKAMKSLRRKRKQAAKRLKKHGVQCERLPFGKEYGKSNVRNDVRMKQRRG
jgi:hypothetical protein